LWRKEKKVDTFLEMPCPMCRTVAQEPSPKEYYPLFEDGTYFYEPTVYDDGEYDGDGYSYYDGRYIDAIEEYPTPAHSQEDEILDSELDYGIEYSYSDSEYEYPEDSQPDSVS
jgi:hypothetical protein